MTETISKTLSSLPPKTQEETIKHKNKERENVLAEMSGQKIKEQEKKKNQRNINELDNDAFMKLFLEQLKNQDPTAPMETDKIITQTAQLTQVEMMEQNKKTMLEVADAMKSTKEVNEELKKFQEEFKESLENLNKGVGDSAKASDLVSQMSSLNTVGMIGKITETNQSTIHLNEEGKVKFSLYFDEVIDTSKGEGVVKIFDSNDTPIAEISLKDKNGQKGYVDFVWEGKLKNGKSVSAGDYKVIAEYNFDDKTQKSQQTRIGRGEVQSVIFQDGKPMLRLGELIVPVSLASEFYEKSIQ